MIWQICCAEAPNLFCLVVNKVDNNTRMLEATEFYSMGFDKLFFVSAISGSGTGELIG